MTGTDILIALAIVAVIAGLIYKYKDHTGSTGNGSSGSGIDKDKF